MKKIYHLSVCSTNRKIIKSLPKTDDFEFQDIKKEPITEAQLDEMYQMTKSYEALFSKKSNLYKSLGLKEQKLTEEDFKKYILEHYTFLNRPVVILDNEIYVGNKPETVNSLIAKLG